MNIQTVTAHQRRIDVIDKAIKDTQNFLDQKAFLIGEDGSRTLLSRAELYDMRAKEEAAVAAAA